MKNLYYVFLLIFFFNKGYSQNDLQNANWIFGNLAWLDFNNNTLISQTAPPYSQNVTSLTPKPFYNTLEGCASVSDEDGRLLFFTDGERVYRVVNNEIIIIDYNSPSDILFGNFSSSQNTIIIPRPNTDGRYFLISMSGMFSGGHGLNWSELDINTNQFISKNNPMSDGVNIIDSSFFNISESITSCVANNGVDIWIIAHVKKSSNYDKVLSFLVTSTGISPTPSSIFDATPLMIPYMPLSLKVSPDAMKLALAYRNSNPFIGTFNNLNGQISIFPTSVGNYPLGSVYSVEFSPNSSILYWSRVVSSYPPNVLTGIYAVDLDNPTNEFQVIGTGINSNSIATLQRGLDGRIYVAKSDQNSIFAIDNTNSFGGWTTSDIILNNGNISKRGLPQWIWSTCKSTSTLISPQDDVDNFISRRERSEWINASNIISNNVNTSAIYHAGNFVELNVGFEGVFGSKFSGYIEGCSNNFQYRQASSSSSTNFSIKKKSNLLLYPNPTNDKVEIKLNNQMFEKVSITTIDGKMMFESDIEKTDKFILDVSRFAQGIYIINVVSENGEIQSQKLIKK